MRLSKDDDPKDISVDVRITEHDKLKKLSDEIDSLKKVISKLKSAPENLEEPPISLKSFLSMLWGVSLELESPENQAKTGSAYRENIFKILTGYNIEKKFDADQKISKQELKHESFVEDLSLLSSRIIHNIAHLRSVHESFIKEGNRKLERLKTKYEDRSNLTSISSEGIITKILAFIAGGSSIPAIGSIIQFTKQETPEEKITRFEKILDITQKYNIDQPITNKTTIVSKFVDTSNQNVTAEKSTTIESSTQIIQNNTANIHDSIINAINSQAEEILINPSNNNLDLALFVVLGIISMVIVNQVYKSKRGGAFEEQRRKQNDDIEKYLKTEFKPKVEKILKAAYMDFKALAIKYYYKKSGSRNDFWRAYINKEGFDHETEIDNYIENIVIPDYIFDYVTKENRDKEIKQKQ